MFFCSDDEPHCDVCSSESASYWCSDCQQWLCRGCKQVHSKIASCKNHTVKALSANVSEVKTQYDKETKAIKDKIEHYTTAAEKIKDKISSLKMTQMEAFGDIGGTEKKVYSGCNGFFRFD